MAKPASDVIVISDSEDSEDMARAAPRPKLLSSASHAAARGRASPSSRALAASSEEEDSAHPCPKPSLQQLALSARTSRPQADEDDDLWRSAAASPPKPKPRSRKKPEPRAQPPLRGVAARGDSWATRHEPQTEADLKQLVDAKRIDALKAAVANALQGLGPRLVVVHGPTGCGKSSACRVLLREMGCAVRTWDGDLLPPSSSYNADARHDARVAYTSPMEDFARFLNDSRFPVLALTGPRPFASAAPAGAPGRAVAVLESLPASPPSSASGANPVHAALYDACAQPELGSAVLLLLSSESEGGLSPSELERIVGPQALPYVCQVQFNALPPGRLEKRLKAVALKEGLGTASASLKALANGGDVRAGINALQFGAGLDARDAALGFTHAVGKVIRAKRDAAGALSYHPETVARNCALDPDVFAAFVFHNMPVYFSDVRDFALVADALSFADALHGRRWGLVEREGTAEDDALDAVGRLVESVVSRAVGTLNRQRPASVAGMVAIRRPALLDVAKRQRGMAEAVRARYPAVPYSTVVAELIPFAPALGRAGPLEADLTRFEALAGAALAPAARRAAATWPAPQPVATAGAAELEDVDDVIEM